MSTTHETETKGGSSASSAAYDRLCPGRFHAQRGLPDIKTSDDESGTRIHAALSENAREGVNVGTLISLSLAEREVFDACREIEKKIILEIFRGEPDNSNRVDREHRFWCRVPAIFEAHGAVAGHEIAPGYLAHSGKADMAMMRKKTGLVLDYKTLYGEHPESSRNEQLRDLAVMVFRTWNLEEVYVAIVQPMVTHTPELCHYTKPDLEQAEAEMWSRVRASNDPLARRIPGPVQCKWCKAASAGTCKEYQSWAGSLIPAPVSIVDVPMASWTPEQCAQFLAGRAVAEKWLSDATDMIKARLEANQEVPGWYLEPGMVRHPVKDPQELFNRFSAAGGSLEQFMECVGITKEKLKQQVHAVSGLKGKALENKLAELLAGITETKQNKSSIARKKEAK